MGGRGSFRALCGPFPYREEGAGEGKVSGGLDCACTPRWPKLCYF